MSFMCNMILSASEARDGERGAHEPVIAAPVDDTVATVVEPVPSEAL